MPRPNSSLGRVAVFANIRAGEALGNLPIASRTESGDSPITAAIQRLQNRLNAWRRLIFVRVGRDVVPWLRGRLPVRSGRMRENVEVLHTPDFSRILVSIDVPYAIYVPQAREVMQGKRDTATYRASNSRRLSGCVARSPFLSELTTTISALSRRKWRQHGV